ncbi:MAG: hypothetical protein NT040_12715 [Bacteroidetes bacterium]|nr:hypothetical protein [Bacteroidota bacterium]
MKENSVKFKWVSRRSEVKKCQDEFTANGAKVEGETTKFDPPVNEKQDYAQSSFDPLLVIFGIASLTFLVQKIISTVRELKHPGYIIDARGDELIFREQPSLKGGSYLVFQKDGTVSKFDMTNSLNADDLVKLIKR